MNRGIYSTATGMVAGQKWLDCITNNLANASTNGFKRDSLAFNDAMVREMNVGGRRIGSMGSGAAEKAQFTIFEQGAITETKNPLDVAIGMERGLFGVNVPTPAGGTATLYTRDGAFQLNQNRELVTKQGFQVLDDQMQPITLPQGKIEIGQDGAIKVDDVEIAKIGVFDGQFVKRGANLFAGNAAPLPPESVRLVPSSLEGSNVDAIESMVQMISINRAFEMAQRSITQQDDLTQRLIQSLQDR